MGLEGSPVGIQEVASVYEAAYAVIYPRYVPVVHVLTGISERSL